MDEIPQIRDYVHKCKQCGCYGLELTKDGLCENCANGNYKPSETPACVDEWDDW